ncbi:MAG: DNA (cytosine-5-)-methyltransferase [Candidatus Anammoxibacter sp.]
MFSGIGGFSLGLERAGMETVALCELEDYPVSILNKHWPDIKVHRDIRKLDGKQYRDSVDLVCGGFPCQPFSVAGKQGGYEDDRHLWPEMFRIIKECKPTWVIGENVAGFVKMALDDVLLDLEAEGYATQSFVIPACAVGAIHRRDRVWIIGYSEHNGRNGSENGQSDSPRNDGNKEGQNETIQSARPSCKGCDDANAKGECRDGREFNKNGRQTLQGETRASGCENDANANNERLQRPSAPGHIKSKREDTKQQPAGLYDFFRQEFKPIRLPTESPVCSKHDGVSDRVARLKALGNAVVPQLPEMIGRAIMGVENE